MEKHEIVFEDLHGTPEVESVEVDLDIEDNAKGITKVMDDEQERPPARNGRDTEGEEPIEREEADEEAERRPVVADADAEEGEGEDLSQYSKNVRKRIERERRLRLKEQADAQYWKEQAEAAQSQLTTARKSVSKESLEVIDTQIASIEKELETAIEEGKSGEQVKLTSKLTDAKAKRITTELAMEADAGGEKPAGSGRVPPSGGANPLVSRWKSEQSDWYGKPGFERQSRLANRIDTEIYNEGFDARTPEYFEELNRRLRKKAPELFDDSDASRAARGARERGRSSPVAPVDRGGSDRPAGRSSKVSLDRADFKNMRDFGLDPNNPTHLKEYAANKREADAQDRQRREGARS